VAIDDHPLAIVDRVDREPGYLNLCARDVDAAATLDGINVKLADPDIVQFLSPAM
jgi:hypothetical protein